MVDGEISALFSFNDFSNSINVVFNPDLISQKRSVFAVHKTMILSTPDLSLKSLEKNKVIKFIGKFC